MCFMQYNIKNCYAQLPHLAQVTWHLYVFAIGCCYLNIIRHGCYKPSLCYFYFVKKTTILNLIKVQWQFKRIYVVEVYSSKATALVIPCIVVINLEKVVCPSSTFIYIHPFIIVQNIVIPSFSSFFYPFDIL